MLNECQNQWRKKWCLFAYHHPFNIYPSNVSWLFEGGHLKQQSQSWFSNLLVTLGSPRVGQVVRDKPVSTLLWDFSVYNQETPAVCHQWRKLWGVLVTMLPSMPKKSSSSWNTGRISFCILASIVRRKMPYSSVHSYPYTEETPH